MLTKDKEFYKKMINHMLKIPFNSDEITFDFITYYLLSEGCSKEEIHEIIDNRSINIDKSYKDWKEKLNVRS